MHWPAPMTAGEGKRNIDGDQEGLFTQTLQLGRTKLKTG
jgi:hypothetical protein